MRPVPYVYRKIMDWVSFGDENHFYTTKTTPQIQKIYISRLFYFPFPWVKGQSREALSSAMW
jgi:hypothetical protein